MIPIAYAPLLVTLHLVGNVVWIGSLLAAAWLCGAARMMAEGPEVGRLARSIYRRFAAPAFVLSLLSGIGRIVASPGDYAHAHWFHAKMAAVVLLIVAHHVVGGRVRKVAGGNFDAAYDMLPLRIAVFLAASAAS
jgi:putative membrane protein